MEVEVVGQSFARLSPAPQIKTKKPWNEARNQSVGSRLARPTPSKPCETKGDGYQYSLVPRPSPPFLYCKRSKTGGGNGLGTRLVPIHIGSKIMLLMRRSQEALCTSYK